MNNNQPVFPASQSLSLETNKVLRNTYMLLSMTLIFSAVMAGISMAMNIPYIVSLGCSLVSLVLIWFVLPRVAHTSKGLGVVFAFTGLMGFGLGPILNHYLNLANGGMIVAQALGGTGVIFVALSGYAMTTRKDFSYLGGFLITGLIVAIIASIANLFFQVPAVSLAISSAVIMIMSGFILYDTSAIINGGQRNYILATVSLYLDIYNIFVNLLHILGVMSDD